MLDVYNYHDKPEQLDGYHEQWRLGGDKLFQYLLRHPDHDGAREMLLSGNKDTILQYVGVTNKPLPGALEALAGDTFRLIRYSALLKWRNPDLEKELLRDKDIESIVLYRYQVMNGDWPESEVVAVEPISVELSVDIIKSFKEALKSINYFRAHEEGQEPLNYQLVLKNSELNVQDEDNEVIGKIIKQGSYCTLYSRDDIVDSIPDDHITSETLTEFIHILSGTW
jgi:hypothetical protein